eukprot:396386-Amphidinium_carterae.1
MSEFACYTTTWTSLRFSCQQPACVRYNHSNVMTPVVENLVLWTVVFDSIKAHAWEEEVNDVSELLERRAQFGARYLQYRTMAEVMLIPRPSIRSASEQSIVSHREQHVGEVSHRSMNLNGQKHSHHSRHDLKLSRRIHSGCLLGSCRLMIRKASPVFCFGECSMSNTGMTFGPVMSHILQCALLHVKHPPESERSQRIMSECENLCQAPITTPLTPKVWKGGEFEKASLEAVAFEKASRKIER